MFLDVNFELLRHLELTTCGMCVFSQHLSARGSHSTVKQRYELKKLLQICQTAEQCVLAFQRRVLTVRCAGSSI